VRIMGDRNSSAILVESINFERENGSGIDCKFCGRG
jgi:hypothetical protein